MRRRSIRNAAPHHMVGEADYLQSIQNVPLSERPPLLCAIAGPSVWSQADVPALRRRLALLRQILATRSCHRSSRTPTQVLTGQAQLAVGEAEEARRSGDSGLMRSFRRPRRPPSGTSQRRNLRGRRAAIADRDLSSPRSHAVMLATLVEPPQLALCRHRPLLALGRKRRQARRQRPKQRKCDSSRRSRSRSHAVVGGSKPRATRARQENRPFCRIQRAWSSWHKRRMITRPCTRMHRAGRRERISRNRRSW